jgi:hypothetical protein
LRFSLQGSIATHYVTPGKGLLVKTARNALQGFPLGLQPIVTLCLCATKAGKRP